MHIVAIGWMFVVLLMTLAEATSPQGTVLGAVVTLVFYGLLPVGIVLYLMNTPHRRRARRRAEAEAAAAGEVPPAGPSTSAPARASAVPTPALPPSPPSPSA